MQVQLLPNKAVKQAKALPDYSQAGEVCNIFFSA